MKQLNVLLVAYAFPPAGGVGTLRAASLARYLPAENIRLDVLTTRNPSSVGLDPSQLADIRAEVRITRTTTVDIPFAWKKRLKRILAGPNASASHPVKASQAATTPQLSKPGLLKRLLQDLLMPDPQVTWLPIARRALRRIIRERNIDLVLITSGPYSALLLAPWLRKHYPELPIVLDFRDEWLTTSFDIASFQFSQSDRARQFAMHSEASAIRSATSIVAVTEAARGEMQGRYPDLPASRFELVPNGFDATRLRRSSPKPLPAPGQRILITYVGTLYNTTNPTLMIEALRALPEADRARLKFRFIGHVEDASYREALLSLGDMVELKGYLPQREALAAMDETDYVLLITHDPINISAKFYDYVGAGKPVLACVNPGGDVRHLLEDLRAGWWSDSSSAESMKDMFHRAATQSEKMLAEFHPDTGKIATYERQPLARRYAEILHRLTA